VSDTVKSLSATKVSCACRCPLQFRFRYVDKIPEMGVGVLLAGRVAHALIEMSLHRVLLGATLPSVKEMDDWFGPTWAAQAKEEEDKSTFIGWEWGDDDPVEKAREETRALAQFTLKEVLPSMKPVAVEQKFDFDISMEDGDSFKIYGVVDLVEAAGFTDWKTAKKAPKRERFPDIQMACYGEWWKREHGPGPAQGRKIALIRGRKPHMEIVPFTIQDRHREWFLRTAREVWKMCRADAFVPNTSGWWCQPGWCSFYDGCIGEL